LESYLTCRFCGHESVKRESFLDLSLSLNNCFPAASRSISMASLPTESAHHAGADAHIIPAAHSGRPTRRSISSEMATEETAPPGPVAVVDEPVSLTEPRRTRTRGKRPATEMDAPAVATAPLTRSQSANALPEIPEASTKAQEQPIIAPATATAPVHLCCDNAAAPIDLTAQGDDDSEERGITLSDCLRAFTTAENLGEKIVRQHALYPCGGTAY
jgi:hypothetical protein